ncbi:putative ribonuclease H-like domain-containing protein [Tanacetum coccineum]
MTKTNEEHGLISLVHQLRRTNHKDFQNCLFACFLSQKEPKKVLQALEDPSWVEAMQNELLQFKLLNVWTLVDLPRDKWEIGTKWAFRNKKDERGIVVKNKARLVAQGHTQEEGIYYDEVFAPVARIEAIRLFLAYASFKDFLVFQMDVKSAFLYGKIEKEVYVCQPPGFEDPHFPNNVYKVEKALYRLHQAPRAWYETLSTYLLDNGFHRGQIDKTLFIIRHKDNILLVQVYVDDIIFGSTRKEMSIEFQKLKHDKFQMSSIGELSFFLGLQVKQKSDGIFISQDKYVAKILKKFDFASVKTASTPMETNKPLIKDEEAENVDVHLYRSMIGSLMYLTASRPDIMFAICACARFQVTPNISHFHAVKRIFRYLKGQPKLGLWYPRDLPSDLEAFSDSDYARASLDRKSTTGGCQFLGKRLISWQCKKQTIVANSTTKAEYVAAANCCGQMVYDDGGVGGGESRVRESEGGDRIDRRMGSLFGLRRILYTPEMFFRRPLLAALTVAALRGGWTVRLSGRESKSKEVETPRYLSLVVPLRKVGDEAVHKELGDRIEMAATTASSSEAEQDSGSGPRCQDTILGDVDAQTRFETTSKQSNDRPFSKVNTFGSGDDSMKILELMAIVHKCLHWHQLLLLVQVPAAEGDVINTLIQEASIRNDLHLDNAEGTDCLPNTIIFEELTKMGYEKPSQKLTFYKAFFSPQWKFMIHTITQSLSAKTTTWNEFSSTMASLIICLATNRKFNLSKYIFDAMVKHLDGGVKFLMYPRFLQVFINQQLGDMSHHKKTFVNPFHTKKIFANMKREGKDFSGRVTPLFDSMLVQASEVVGEDSIPPTDSTQIPIIDQPSTSFQPKKKQKSRKKQKKEAEVANDEAEQEENIPTPSNDPLPSGEDSMQLIDLMAIEIASLKKRVDKLEKRRQLRITGLNRFKKLGTARRVKSCNASLGAQEDASKQRRSIEDIDADAEVFVDVATISTADIGGVTAAKIDELTLAQTLIEIKASKPKVVITTATTTTTTSPKARGVVVQEPSEFRTSSVAQPSMINRRRKATGSRKKSLGKKRGAKELQQESPKKQKLEDDEESDEHEQVKADYSDKLKRKVKRQGWPGGVKVGFREEVRRLRNRSSSRRKRETSGGHRQEVHESKEKKVEGSEETAKGSKKKMLRRKRAGKEQQQESSKKQRMEEDKESDEVEEVSEDDEGELMKHLVIKKDEDIAIDAIPLATKLPVIINYKLHKEGMMVQYQLIRADGSSKIYSSMIRMLQGIDKEDLEAL